MRSILVLTVPLLALVVGCGGSSDTRASASTSSNLVASDDLILANSGNGGVLLLNSSGEYKATLFSIDKSLETIGGIGWSKDRTEIFITVDGADRVMAVSAKNGSVRYAIVHPALAGALRGITQLSSGEILVVESNNIERFTANGTRVTSGGWPLSLQTSGSEIRAMANGGFVLCSTGSDLVATYTDAGVLVSSAVSGIAGTTDATGCRELADGTIAVTWSGTTDTVEIRSADLATVVATYSDLAVLRTPTSVTQKANGNLLISGSTYQHLIEIKTTGEFVSFVASVFCNSVTTILAL